MNEIDLNDTVTVELSEWGATYLNAMNTFNKMISPIEAHPFYKTNYKAGDIYKDQLGYLILDFKDGVRIDKEKPFNKLKKLID